MVTVKIVFLKMWTEYSIAYVYEALQLAPLLFIAKDDLKLYLASVYSSVCYSIENVFAVCFCWSFCAYGFYVLILGSCNVL